MDPTYSWKKYHIFFVCSSFSDLNFEILYITYLLKWLIDFNWNNWIYSFQSSQNKSVIFSNQKDPRNETFLAKKFNKQETSSKIFARNWNRSIFKQQQRIILQDLARKRPNNPACFLWQFKKGLLIRGTTRGVGSSKKTPPKNGPSYLTISRASSEITRWGLR